MDRREFLRRSAAASAIAAAVEPTAHGANIITESQFTRLKWSMAFAKSFSFFSSIPMPYSRNAEENAPSSAITTFAAARFGIRNTLSGISGSRRLAWMPTKAASANRPPPSVRRVSAEPQPASLVRTMP